MQPNSLFVCSMAVHPNQVTIATGQKSAVSESEQKDVCNLWLAKASLTSHGWLHSEYYLVEVN